MVPAGGAGSAPPVLRPGPAVFLKTSETTGQVQVIHDGVEVPASTAMIKEKAAAAAAAQLPPGFSFFSFFFFIIRIARHVNGQ